MNAKYSFDLQPTHARLESHRSSPETCNLNGSSLLTQKLKDLYHGVSIDII